MNRELEVQKRKRKGGQNEVRASVLKVLLVGAKGLRVGAAWTLVIG